MSITSRAENAREDARKRGGEFGTQEHSAPELALSGQLDLSTQTPVDIDTRLAELNEERLKVSAHYEYYEQTAEKKQAALEAAAEAGEKWDGQLAHLTREAEAAQAKVDHIVAEVSRIRAEAKPYEQEYRDRGRWTRAFLTTSANGHVHSSMHCSTCNREGTMTRFAWMTEYSGAEESTIVEDAGQRACTTCFPTAPTEVLNRPTKMFTPDEKRKAEERAERDAAKVERDAKKIANGLTADGSEFEVVTEVDSDRRRARKEYFKTERSAVMWATDHLAWYAARDDDPERQEVQRAAIQSIAEAIAVKHDQPVEFALAELRVKADIKLKKYTKKVGDQKIAELAAKLGYQR